MGILICFINIYIVCIVFYFVILKVILKCISKKLSLEYLIYLVSYEYCFRDKFFLLGN